MRGLLALAPANVPRLNQVHISWPVLLFAAALTIAAAVGVGIVPALKSMRVRPETTLRANTMRAAITRESWKTRNVLVGGAGVHGGAADRNRAGAAQLFAVLKQDRASTPAT